MGDLDASLLPGKERIHHSVLESSPGRLADISNIIFGFLFSTLGFGLFINYSARIDWYN